MSDKAVHKCGSTWEYCDGKCSKCHKKDIQYCTSTQDISSTNVKYKYFCAGFNEFGCEADHCDNCFYNELNSKERKF